MPNYLFPHTHIYTPIFCTPILCTPIFCTCICSTSLLPTSKLILMERIFLRWRLARPEELSDLLARQQCLERLHLGPPALWFPFARSIERNFVYHAGVCTLFFLSCSNWSSCIRDLQHYAPSWHDPLSAILRNVQGTCHVFVFESGGAVQYKGVCSQAVALEQLHKQLTDFHLCLLNAHECCVLCRLA